MSSGLVATMGLPAQAVGRGSSGEAAAPATAPIAVQPVAVQPVAVQPVAALQTGLIAAPADFQTGEVPLTAPAAATVSFENSAYTAIPTKVVAPMSSVSSSNTAGHSSVPAALSGSFGSARGSSVLAVAARYIGVPYVYGGTTPIGWDCSGATSYIFRQLGIPLPRTANEQMLATTRIPRSAARPGDLVFFVYGGRAEHVGVYAGGNMMYDAQRSGKSFTKRAIYTSAVYFGRVSR